MTLSSLSGIIGLEDFEVMDPTTRCPRREEDPRIRYSEDQRTTGHQEKFRNLEDRIPKYFESRLPADRRTQGHKRGPRVWRTIGRSDGRKKRPKDKRTRGQ